MIKGDKDDKDVHSFVNDDKLCKNHLRFLRVPAGSMQA